MANYLDQIYRVPKGMVGEIGAEEAAAKVEAANARDNVEEAAAARRASERTQRHLGALTEGLDTDPGTGKLRAVPKDMWDELGED